jgi:hypothetical protein
VAMSKIGDVDNTKSVEAKQKYSSMSADEKLKLYSYAKFY